MPPKRKLAPGASKEPEIDSGAASVSTKIKKRGRVGQSADRQTVIAAKYGTSSRVLRSQSTDSKGKHIVSAIPKKRVEKPSHAHNARGRQARKNELSPPDSEESINDEMVKRAELGGKSHVTEAPGKEAKKEASQAESGPSQNEKEADEHANGHNGDLEQQNNEPAPVKKPPGKRTKKKQEILAIESSKTERETTDHRDTRVEKDASENSIPIVKTRGKGAKKRADEAAQAAEEHSNAEETNGSNGSEAPKEETKRGRKGKPNASKTEPEPDEKKAKLDEEPESYECEKTNKKGEKWNLKIATWNVASLRACVKKGMIDYVAKEDADIICFQETKCSEEKAPAEAKVEGYHTYWCSGSGKKDGYAGVALFTKEKPLNVNFGIGDEEYDAEGRLITAEYDKFYLVTTYVPNSGQGLKTLPKRMKWDELFLAYLKKLDAQKPVVLCGDLNVAHEEIDLKNPKTNTKSAGFTPEERANMTKLLGEGFVDSFRHLYPDKTGAYTFWTYLGNARAKNTGWRLDYFVLSERLMDSVCDVVIRSKVLGSDHCPTTLFIHI